MSYFANLPRSAAPVASYPFGIQNTTLLMSFVLRTNQPCFKSPLIGLTFALPPCLFTRMIRLNDYPLVFSTHRFGSIQLDHHSLLELTDWLCSYPFGLISPTYCLLPFNWQGMLSSQVLPKCNESSLTRTCIDRPSLAQLRRSPCFGHITVVILTTLYRHSYFSTIP